MSPTSSGSRSSIDVAVAVDADVIGDVDPPLRVLVVLLVLAEASRRVAVVAEDHGRVVDRHAAEGVGRAAGVGGTGAPSIPAQQTPEAALDVGAVEVMGSRWRARRRAGRGAAGAVGLGVGDELGAAVGSVEQALTVATAKPAVPASRSSRRRLSSGPPSRRSGGGASMTSRYGNAVVDCGQAALSSTRIAPAFAGVYASGLCKIRACQLLMVRYLLATPSCAYWAPGEWARSILCGIHGCPVWRR